jgi:hypothetical protein
MKTKPLRLAELIEHFRKKELAADNEWKTLSTRVTYEGPPKKVDRAEVGSYQS